MLRNYVTTALRHFRKYKGHTMINMAGLTAGIACSLLISLWVADELRMDRFHTKESRTYQILRNMHLAEGQVVTTTAIPQPLKPRLEAAYPEIEDVTLISWEMERLFRYGTQAFKERGRHVSRSFFDIFSFDVVAGDRKTGLNDIHSIMISRTLAHKYFGSPQLALNQTIRIDDLQDFTVSAIFEDPGPNSSLQFDWLIPDHEYITRNTWVESWYNGGFSIVCTLRPEADATAFAARLEQEINAHTNHEADERLVIQKFGDRYLYGTFELGVSTGGRIDYVNLLIIVALFTLAIACINFMNLTTAQSSRRAKEIGMRKVMGAPQAALSAQFLTESFVLALLAAGASLVIVAFLIPSFNSLTGKHIVLNLTSPVGWLYMIGLIAVVGLLSGSYPAFTLPRVQMSQAKSSSRRSGGKMFRQGLVVFQFGVSILLIVGTIAVYRQINFIMSKNLGVDRSNVILIELEGELASRFPTYKDKLLNIPGVSGVTSSSGNPLSYGRSSSSPTWEGKDPQQEIEMNIMMVDDDFLTAMKATLLQGRGFSRERADSARFIINEEAAHIMGFDNALGKSLTVWGTRGEIVGVVKNFHMSSLYEPIAPLIMRYAPAEAATALIRISGDIQTTLSSIRALTLSFNPGLPFTYEFLDDTYSASYRSEQVVGILVSGFASMAIFISCLGLLGLCSFSAEQRKKELGIRRVHGASRTGLVILMSSEYAVLIAIALLAFTPAAWYFSNEWLDRFAFRTSLSFEDLLASGLVLCAIAGATVVFKSYQAASANPVQTLKEE
jgi:putative ABC transport system permease protein